MGQNMLFGKSRWTVVLMGEPCGLH